MKPLSEIPKIPRLLLHSDTERLWGQWADAHGRKTHSAADDATAAMLSKVEAYAARIALVFAWVDDPDAQLIPPDAMERATILANWFAAEARRIYQTIAKSDEDRNRRAQVEYFRRYVGASAREVARSLRRFKGDSTLAKTAMDDLVKHGLGRWEHVQSGGRPTVLFRLIEPADVIPRLNPADTADADESPPGAIENRPSGYVGAVGSSEIGTSVGADSDDIAAALGAVEGAP